MPQERITQDLRRSSQQDAEEDAWRSAPFYPQSEEHGPVKRPRSSDWQSEKSVGASEYVPCPVVSETFGHALPNSRGVPFLTAREVELAADLFATKLKQGLLPKVVRADEL